MSPGAAVSPLTQAQAVGWISAAWTHSIAEPRCTTPLELFCRPFDSACKPRTCSSQLLSPKPLKARQSPLMYAIIIKWPRTKHNALDFPCMLGVGLVSPELLLAELCSSQSERTCVMHRAPLSRGRSACRRWTRRFPKIKVSPPALRHRPHHSTPYGTRSGVSTVGCAARVPGPWTTIPHALL